MRLIVIAISFLVACGGQVAGADGGTDGAICIDLEVSAFDTSCSVASDCIGIYAGNLCSGYNCICPVASISAASEAAYQAALAKVTEGQPACGCPLFGTAHCIASQCVFCPNPALNPSSYPPGCPDGGP